MIDISRRMFCFGAAAALIVPPPKSFFIVRPPPLIMAPLDKPMFDLPLQQMLELMRKLDEQRIELSAIPRWVVCDKEWYDEVVGHADPRTVDGPQAGDGGAGPHSLSRSARG